MATEFEIQQRRLAATERQEQLVAMLSKFMTGEPGETVDLETGSVRTLRSIVADLETARGDLNSHIGDANAYLVELTTALDAVADGN